MRRALAFLPLALAAALPLSAQAFPKDARLQDAWLQWDRGEYDKSLASYIALLNAADAAQLVPQIALATGELYQVDEVTKDGRAQVRVSPSGRYGTFETQVAVANGAPQTITQVFEIASGQVVYTVRQSGVVLVGGNNLVMTTAPQAGTGGVASQVVAPGGDRVAWVRSGTAGRTELVMRAISNGQDGVIDLQGWIPGGNAPTAAGTLVAAPDGDALYILASRDAAAPPTDIIKLSGATVTPLPTGEGRKSAVMVARGGRFVVFTSQPLPPAQPAAPAGAGAGAGAAGGRAGGAGGAGGGGGGGGAGGGRAGGGAAGAATLVILDTSSGATTRLTGKTAPTLSADGSTLAFLGREGTDYTVEVMKLGAATTPTVVVRQTPEIATPALSPSGRMVAYAARPFADWDVYVAPTTLAAGAAPACSPCAQAIPTAKQLSKEIQHDQAPKFIDENRVLTWKGEPRHRRTYIYDVTTAEQTKLFHNNTVRTVAPEYEWVISPDGKSVVIIADRDGDTISPERGVYVVHLDRQVTLAQLRTRLQAALTAEQDLRVRGLASFAGIAARVAPVTEQVDVARIYQYAKTVYEFGSKYITQPGNAMAIEYYSSTLRSWGYEVEVQWFDTPNGGGTVRTANIVARLPGTVNPELVYTLSSHFDSVERGPGADDNSSGSTALLEAARVMKDHPQAATIEFAWFTGEEAGLRGSREYVRLAVASGKKIAGALNNDMIGWTRNYRLDNTIRYSNPGIRDIQHAAAMQFSKLITYDARYYRSTDAAAYFDAYGDIVGGIGSYPILESPYYHQPNDRLENINQQLVAEVSKTTVATLMLLASSPARLKNATATAIAADGSATLTWDAAPEKGITAYIVRTILPNGQTRDTRVTATAGQARPTTRVAGAAAGSSFAIKAVNQQGLEGWDWAYVTPTGR